MLLNALRLAVFFYLHAATAEFSHATGGHKRSSAIVRSHRTGEREEQLGVAIVGVATYTPHDTSVGSETA